MAITAIILTGCTKDNGGNEEIPDSQIIIESSPVPILAYRFGDLSGFECDDKLMDLYEYGIIDYGNNCKLKLQQDGTLIIELDESAPEVIANNILKDYNRFSTIDEFSGLGTIGSFIYTLYQDKLIMGGINHNKIWFGLFDTKTKQLEKSWEETETLDRVITVDMGYGESQDEYIDQLRIYEDEVILTSSGFAMLAIPYKSMFICVSDDEIKSTLLPPHAMASTNIRSWYNESIMIETYVESYKIDYYIFDIDGNEIDSFYGDYIRDFDYDNWYPCSYTDQIGVGINNYWGAISRQRLSASFENGIGTTVWRREIDAFEPFVGSFNVRMTSRIISINNNLWEMEYEGATSTSGKIKVHFVIDIDTGEISYL